MSYEEQVCLSLYVQSTLLGVDPDLQMTYPIWINNHSQLQLKHAEYNWIESGKYHCNKKKGMKKFLQVANSFFKFNSQEIDCFLMLCPPSIESCVYQHLSMSVIQLLPNRLLSFSSPAVVISSSGISSNIPQVLSSRSIMKCKVLTHPRQ